MRRLVCLIAVLSACLVATEVAAAASDSGSVRQFRTQAKDTYCVATYFPGSSPPTVTCSSKVPLNPPTPKGPPKQCIGDPGNGLIVNHRGRARGFCLSQSPFVGPFAVLPYGKTIRFHGIHCHAVSQAIGIRCVNAVGHGFSMGSGNWRLF